MCRKLKGIEIQKNLFVKQYAKAKFPLEVCNLKSSKVGKTTNEQFQKLHLQIKLFVFCLSCLKKTLRSLLTRMSIQKIEEENLMEITKYLPITEEIALEFLLVGAGYFTLVQRWST